MITPEDARRRVALGSALLDRVSPGWASLIDLASLDMGSCSECVLGQCMGWFTSAAFSLWPDDDQFLSQAEAHGFTLTFAASLYVSDAEEHWHILRNAWIEIVSARQAPAAEAGSNLAELLGVA